MLQPYEKMHSRLTKYRMVPMRRYLLERPQHEWTTVSLRVWEHKLRLVFR